MGFEFFGLQGFLHAAERFGDEQANESDGDGVEADDLEGVVGLCEEF